MAHVSRRDEVLATLRDSSVPLGINAIAEQLGVHPNTVRFHLDALVAAGRVEQVAGGAARPGRPPHLYRASRRMDRTGPTNYRLLARMLAQHLTATERHPEQAAAGTGREWGPELIESQPAAGRGRTAALTRLIGMLDGLGFRPEPLDARATQVRLRHCPFLELIDEHGDIVCALHLGLMQGALSATGARVTVDRLDRFVEPDLCVGHVAAQDAR